jgi:hypothetical protein
VLLCMVAVRSLYACTEHLPDMANKRFAQHKSYLAFVSDISSSAL